MSKEILTLRGHHIPNLCDYLTAKKLDFVSYAPYPKIILEYGKEYCKNQEEVLEKMSLEDSLIRIIAKHDSFCSKCNFKVKKGCFKDGVLYKLKRTGSEKDKEHIKYFGLELNKTYSGKEMATLLAA